MRSFENGANLGVRGVRGEISVNWKQGWAFFFLGGKRRKGKERKGTKLKIWRSFPFLSYIDPSPFFPFLSFPSIFSGTRSFPFLSSVFSIFSLRSFPFLSSPSLSFPYLSSTVKSKIVPFLSLPRKWLLFYSAFLSFPFLPRFQKLIPFLRTSSKTQSFPFLLEPDPFLSLPSKLSNSVTVPP